MFKWANKWVNGILLTVLVSANCLASTPPVSTTTDYGKTFSFDSKVLEQTRELQVYLPEGYDKSQKTYPVLVVLDAQNYFLHGVTFQKTLKFVEKTPDFIVIGVNTHFRKRRALYAHHADNFIKFLSTELMPFVEKNYRISDERILFGWEMAGGLAAQTMGQTDLFSAYLMASPTHIEETRLAAITDKLAKKPKKLPYVYFTQSEDEAFTDEINDTLTKIAPKSFDWQSERLMGDDHHTTPYRTIYKGLRDYFSDYPPVIFWSMDEYHQYGGMEKLKSHYAKRGLRYDISQNIHDRTQYSLLLWSKREDNYKQFDIFLTEFTSFTDAMAFPGWGDDWSQFYIKHKKFAKAKAVLVKSLSQFPDSAMLHAGMGDTLAGLGQKDAAAKSYKKAIALAIKDEDPAAEDYQKKLKNL